MYGTEFTEIYHLFLNSIQDYHIKNLFREDISIAEDLLETFLMKSIPKFKNCSKDISDVDMLNKCFRVSLNIEEKNIITNLMLLSWLEYTINDITQMNLSLNDNDFKHFSEEKNLKEKSTYADKVREKVSQDIVEYGLYRTPFADWAVGKYGL